MLAGQCLEPLVSGLIQHSITAGINHMSAADCESGAHLKAIPLLTLSVEPHWQLSVVQHHSLGLTAKF